MNGKQVAERFAEAALANYGRDGKLHPAVTLLGNDNDTLALFIPHVAPETHGMPGAMGAIGIMFGTILPVRWMIVVSEAWGKFSTTEDDARITRKGELEERAKGGDTTIHTMLIISAYDMADPDNSYCLQYDADDKFARTGHAGIGQGEMADAAMAVAGAVRIANQQRPTGTPPPNVMKMAMDAIKEYVQAGMFPQEDED